jgi:hypothetical protein
MLQLPLNHNSRCPCTLSHLRPSACHNENAPHRQYRPSYTGAATDRPQGSSVSRVLSFKQRLALTEASDMRVSMHALHELKGLKRLPRSPTAHTVHCRANKHATPQRSVCQDHSAYVVQRRSGTCCMKSNVHRISIMHSWQIQRFAHAATSNELHRTPWPIVHDSAGAGPLQNLEGAEPSCTKASEQHTDTWHPPTWPAADQLPWIFQSQPHST